MLTKAEKEMTFFLAFYNHSNLNLKRFLCQSAATFAI